MTILETQIGKWYRVEDVKQKENVQRRLQALGILEGTRVQVLNRKKGGSVIIRVRGTRWALGSEIAKGIEVNEYDEQ